MKGKGGPENASCKYKGVRQRIWGKWVSEIREPNHGERIWLGTFDDSSAALAYDKSAIRIFGATAKLNFSDRLPQVSLPVHDTASTCVDAITDRMLYGANTKLNSPDALPQASMSCPICATAATSVDAIADQILYGANVELNFSDRLPQVSLPVQTTSVDAIDNRERIKILEEGLIELQHDEYPPGDEVSLISNPYACLVNDHVYDYYDQFILLEKQRSVAPTVDHGEFQGINVVKNDGYQKEKRDDIKENMRVELPEYDDSSLWAEVITTTDFGKIKDTGVVIAGNSLGMLEKMTREQTKA